MPNVQRKTPDDGQRNCPKHVDFLDKNKLGKISASVGFIKNKFVTLHGHTNEKLDVIQCFSRVHYIKNEHTHARARPSLRGL
jgi:hypothetical protein